MVCGLLRARDGPRENIFSFQLTYDFALMLKPGGDSAYERGGDARRKFWIKPLRKTNLGVAQPFLTPKSDHFKLWLDESSKYNELKIYNFLIFLRVQP